MRAVFLVGHSTANKNIKDSKTASKRRRIYNKKFSHKSSHYIPRHTNMYSIGDSSENAILKYKNCTQVIFTKLLTDEEALFVVSRLLLICLRSRS